MSSSQILLPFNEQRQYEYLKLENGLDVVLIHDSKAEKYAAGMSVCVGSNSDPGMFFFFSFLYLFIILFILFIYIYFY